MRWRPYSGARPSPPPPLLPPPTTTTTADTSASSDSLAEVTVTATRRSENIQNVPISMQAMTSETLQQLNISTLDDYIKYLPNVTTANNGPGQNEVFMRGLSAGSQPSQGSASTGLWPNVAIYLDNQSGQLPNRNLDIYAADLNRIEVLEGPQGTLFGSGAEAGVIRYITNEPKLDTTEGSVKAGYGVTAHGDPNSNLMAVLNLPLISDTLAVRAVIYDDKRGGYINNVPATFTRKDTDIGIHYANYPASATGTCPDGGTQARFLRAARQPEHQQRQQHRQRHQPGHLPGYPRRGAVQDQRGLGLPVHAVLPGHELAGRFLPAAELPPTAAPLSPLEVTLFNNAFDKDKFESTAWTLNGKVGPLKAVYTGGYLVRNVEQVGDYTNYARGVYADYYQCYGPGTGGDANLKSTCFSPSATWFENERNTHQQHELRFSTPDDWRLRAIVGAFWENNTLCDQAGWNYKTVPSCTTNDPAGTGGNSGCFSDIGTVPGTTVVNPGVQGIEHLVLPGHHADDEADRFLRFRRLRHHPEGTDDHGRHAPFPLRQLLGRQCQRQLRLLRGRRAARSSGCLQRLHYNLNAQHLQDTEIRLQEPRQPDLAHHAGPHGVLHVLAGLPPGRLQPERRHPHAYGTGCGVQQYLIPSSYQSDKLTNNEIGWKTEFFDHRLQWNGAVYRENWDNVQVAFFDPGLVGNIFYNTNGQNFLIKGIETSLVARVMSGLTVQGAASWNQSRQTNSPQLIDNNPASANYGKPITQNCDSTGAVCSPVTNPFGPIGSPSANAPPIQFSARARYEWVDGGGYVPFVQVGVTHTRSFVHAGGLESDDRGSRRHQHRPVAIRESRLHDRRGLGRRLEGQLGT